MKKDSKPCPNCKVLIHRFVGCPAMWCTACHVYFDWNTLKITKNGHNPHAYEYYAQNPQNRHNHGENGPCGGVNAYAINMSTLKYKDQRLHLAIVDTIARASTDNLWKCPGFSDTENTNLDSLRVRYMKGELTEKEWKKLISIQKIKDERYRIFSQIRNTYATLGMDQLRNFYILIENAIPPDDWIEEVEGFDFRVVKFETTYLGKIPNGTNGCVPLSNHEVWLLEKKRRAPYSQRGIDAVLLKHHFLEFYHTMCNIRDYINDTIQKELAIYETKSKYMIEEDTWRWVIKK